MLNSECALNYQHQLKNPLLFAAAATTTTTKSIAEQRADETGPEQRPDETGPARVEDFLSRLL